MPYRNPREPLPGETEDEYMRYLVQHVDRSMAIAAVVIFALLMLIVIW